MVFDTPQCPQGLLRALAFLSEQPVYFFCANVCIVSWWTSTSIIRGRARVLVETAQEQHGETPLGLARLPRPVPWANICPGLGSPFCDLMLSALLPVGSAVRFYTWTCLLYVYYQVECLLCWVDFVDILLYSVFEEFKKLSSVLVMISASKTMWF